MLPVNHSSSRLFDKKFVALTLRDARHCAKCKHEYDIKYKCSATDNKPHSSRPVLLNCGHNICENCIYQNRHNISCGVCSIPIVFEHTRWLKRSYDLNFSLLGQLVNSKSFLASETSPNAAGAYMQNTGMLSQELFIQKCSECEQATAIGICMRCKVEFCKRCFTAVHQHSKVLKKHKLSEFETQTLQLRLPNEKVCKMHKRLCDRFCSDCQGVYCSQCVRVTHNTHRVTTLAIENANHKDKIISFLETMKQTREHIKKAQKEARVCENRLEDFATYVILEVNDFFLELHNMLQLKEREVVEYFKKSALASQKTIHEAFAKLSDGQTTLNNMRASLEGYVHKPPNGFHINAAIELATIQLEQIPCQIQISEIERSPFVFKKIKNIHSEISKSFEAIAEDPKITIRITPMYSDLASFEISSERSISPESTASTRMDSIDYRTGATPKSSSSTPIGRSKRVGRVTSIVNPSHFFVQDDDAIARIRLQLADIDGKSGQVESVDVGEMYLVYHVVDKAWFRGVVKEELQRPKKSKDIDALMYKVFLLDYGIYEEVHKKYFRTISEEVKLISEAAACCSLLDVAPSGKQWTTESRELMEEIIQNKPVQLNIQNTTTSPWNVEISTINSGEPISIRDALLYTGLGIDSSATVSQSNLKFTGVKPTQVSKMKHRLQRPMLHSGEFFRIQISHIENPQQFFAVKFVQLEDLANLESAMDMEYSGKQSDTIYCAKLHMCCALLVDDKWYRGCVEEITNPNNIRVRLVDNGRSVTVDWRQLRALKECFTCERELSIECSIADIQPLQENNYEWTDAAIAEFIRMTSNPNTHMTIASSSQFRYQVILNVVKKHLDINIGAMLVKFQHALTTGEASTVTEIIRNKKSPLDPLCIPEGQIKQQRSASTETSVVRTLKRTPIQVIYINNPGEFYIHLVEHIPGILKFNEELQLAQEKRLQDDSIEDLDWKLNDHCLALTQINDNAAAQWFRGVIVDIDANACYTVFLRDRGLTVRDLRKNKLNSIDNLFDRICNAAILCHLACVHPTGGMKSWSHSSIDEFIHNTRTFESLGATIQGATKNSSIPVVLWGMMTESNDPLAPCTTKYTNINKLLVSAGLAHMTEKIDITRQLDQFVQAEMELGQQTLQDWYENFKKTLEELPECLDDRIESESEISIASGYQIAEPIQYCETSSQWLPPEPILKTVFTGYPTYVDYEAIVYLHDADKHSLLSKMRNKINEEVELMTSLQTNDDNWRVGQPCLARYHLDNSVYRATIQRQLTDMKYEVRFIDYGNIEACESRDLYKMMLFSNIPTQAVRFRIDGIKPRGEQECFNVTVLDLIHGVIVGKLCSIRVPNGEENKEIKKCSISFCRTDLATYLIQNDFAASSSVKMSSIVPKKKLNTNRLPLCPITTESEIKEDSNNSDDELREFMKQRVDDPTEGPATRTPPEESQVADAMFNPEEYRRLFEKMQSEKLYKSITEIESDHYPQLDDAVTSDEDEDVVELEFSFRSNYWHVDHNVEGGQPPMPQSDVESNFDNFEPFDSSSLLSNFSGIEAFKVPQLPSSLKSFYCDVPYIRSPTILHVFPHLSELTYRQVELARRIQLMARKMPLIESFELKLPCLARYSKDKLWYRAIIRSHNAITHQVKVFYVDFLNSELLAEENIRRCPKDLLSWPLRTFEMKLFGLQSNPGMRETEVKKAVKKCLKGRTLYAKIIRERGKMTEVCLFKSKSEKEVPVYEDLIVEKYFCKE